MTARRSPAGKAAACARQLTIHAEAARVFDAIATLDGPAHWWTTIVTGSAVPGGTLRFGFAGLDEQIVMRVGLLQVTRPKRTTARKTLRIDSVFG